MWSPPVLCDAPQNRGGLFATSRSSSIFCLASIHNPEPLPPRCRWSSVLAQALRPETTRIDRRTAHAATAPGCASHQLAFLLDCAWLDHRYASARGSSPCVPLLLLTSSLSGVASFRQVLWPYHRVSLRLWWDCGGLMITDLHLAANEIRVPPSRNARRVDVTAKYNSLRVRIPFIYWPYLASRHSSRS